MSCRPWLGRDDLHLSHRSSLLRKDPAHYRPLFGDDVPEDLEYVWPASDRPRRCLPSRREPAGGADWAHGAVASGGSADRRTAAPGGPGRRWRRPRAATDRGAGGGWRHRRHVGGGGAGRAGCGGHGAGGGADARRSAGRLAGGARRRQPAATSTASTRSSGSTTTGGPSSAGSTRDLGFLKPIPGYPILSEQWPTEEFGKLPPAPPANLLALLLRSPSLRLADLRLMDRDAALPLLSYDPVRTYAELDDTTADELLASLRLPDRARAMLFEVFSHSFFNHEAEMSAAEMVAQFHFYLLGNPEGLAFDCPDEDYATAIWEPLTRHVEKHGGRVLHQLRRHRGAPRRRGLAGDDRRRRQPPGRATSCSPSTRRRSPRWSRPHPDLAEQAPELAARMPAFGTPGPPYAVARYWCDGDVAAERAVFSGVSRQPTLDSVTLYHRLENEPRRWARQTGGSVIELHAYACEPGVPAEELAERMRRELVALWPEAGRPAGPRAAGPGGGAGAGVHAGQPRLAAGGTHRRDRPLPGRRRHRHGLPERVDGTLGGDRDHRREPHPAR